VIGRPRLVGVHANHRVFRGDHVLVYRVDNWEPCTASQQGEIRAVGWFAVDKLPHDHQPRQWPADRRALGGAEASPHW
jgi:hypothetical protein